MNIVHVIILTAKVLKHSEHFVQLPTQNLVDIKNLKNAMEHYVEVNNYQCQSPSCNGKGTKKRTLQNHLFIEADQVDDICNFTMADFPTTLEINDDR